MKEIGWKVKVLTALPNYPINQIYSGYESKKRVNEFIDGIQVIRSWIYVSSSRNIVSRLLNYFSFTWSSWRIGRGLEKSEIIICESPPLFLGITAVLLKRKWKSGLVFNVSDLWPESAEKLGIVTNKVFLGLAYKLESYIYRNSDLISGQTNGIIANIQSRFKSSNTYWLPNGFDFTGVNLENLSNGKGKDKIFSYAGVLGHAQGLEVILKAANLLKDQNHIKFLIMGDGPETKKLRYLQSDFGLNNVEFSGPIDKSEVLERLRNVTASIVPLKKLDLFKGAIPSKIFESLALKKPILLGVEGEAKEIFIDKGNAGISFEPEDPESLKKSILNMIESPDETRDMGISGYHLVKEQFDRKIIASKFSSKLEKVFYESQGDRY